jgi:hypothetical protein
MMRNFAVFCKPWENAFRRGPNWCSLGEVPWHYWAAADLPLILILWGMTGIRVSSIKPSCRRQKNSGFLPNPFPSIESFHYPRAAWNGTSTLEFGNLEIFIADPYSIALSKIDRGYDTDLEDVVFLIHHQYVNPDDLELIVMDALRVANQYDFHPNILAHLHELKRRLT